MPTILTYPILKCVLYIQLVATKLTLSKQYPIWVALQMPKLIQFKGQSTTQYLQKYYESLKENILNGQLAHSTSQSVLVLQYKRVCRESATQVYICLIKYKWHIYMVNLVFKE